MTPIKKIPNVNNYLRFKSEYTFVTEYMESYPLPKGSLAKVITRDITEARVTDEVECKLVISLMINDKVRLFKFNFSVHQDLVEVLEETAALEVLFGPKKLT